MSELHTNYTDSSRLEHRKQFGQFFTDERIARFMLRWVLESGARELYDPAFGLGAFYLAARAMREDVAFAASEVDPAILRFWRERSVSDNLTLSREDYLHSWGSKRSAIVCNPPYMRFQKFVGRDEAFAAFQQHLGLRLSGYTNIASAFLVKSVSELGEGGRLAYVMPLEFLNTGYGISVKRYLLTEGRIHALVRLACEKDAFPDVTTSVGIVLLEKTRAHGSTGFYTVRTLDELDRLLDSAPVNAVRQDQLQPEDKWASHFGATRLQLRSDHLVPLSTYGAFIRGIATGANEFFVLRPSQIASLDLAKAEVVECITKSAQIRKPVFTDSDLDRLAAADAPIYLFRGGRPLSEEGARYIRQGEIRGYHTRYLTRMRDPWYRLESRQPSPILLGVFSRGGYKVVRNYSRALNLTAYHGFQPNIFGQQFVDRLFLYLVSASGRGLLALNIRKYGDSLDKFEPNDLNQALVPSMNWFERIGEGQATQEIAEMTCRGRLSSQLEELFGDLAHAQQPQSRDMLAHA